MPPIAPLWLHALGVEGVSDLAEGVSLAPKLTHAGQSSLLGGVGDEFLSLGAVPERRRAPPLLLGLGRTTALGGRYRQDSFRRTRTRLERSLREGCALAADDETPNPARAVSKSRMEAFSDGVLAIAITLLVLDLAVHPPGSPLRQFLQGWPSYVAYGVSFLTIGAAWVAHNALTDRLDRSDSILLRLNLVFLLVVAFLPFPTRLVAESLHDTTDAKRVAVVVYGLTLLAIRLTFYALDVYSRREHLRLPGADDPDLQEERRKFRFVVVGYTITILVGLVLPVAAVVLYFGIAVFLVVPFRTVTQLLFGKHPQ